MSNNTIKIIYNDSFASFPSAMPTTMMPTILITNNNPTVNILMTAWVIIQIFFFLFLSFSIMTMISYIFRIRLAREVIQR
jgi:hypothetical protein